MQLYHHICALSIVLFLLGIQHHFCLAHAPHASHLWIYSSLGAQSVPVSVSISHLLRLYICLCLCSIGRYNACAAKLFPPYHAYKPATHTSALSYGRRCEAQCCVYCRSEPMRNHVRFSPMPAEPSNWRSPQTSPSPRSSSPMPLDLDPRVSSEDLINNAHPNLNGIDPARARWSQKGIHPQPFFGSFASTKRSPLGASCLLRMP